MRPATASCHRPWTSSNLGAATKSSGAPLGIPAYLWALGALVIIGLVTAGVVLVVAADDGDDTSYRTDVDTPNFEEFAPRAAEAAERGDITFFTDRVFGTTQTCTEADVEASQNNPTAICNEVGQQFQAVAINGYGGSGVVTTADSVKQEIAALFDEALPDTEDSKGDGGTRLYATAFDEELQLPDRPTHTALLTSLINVAGTPGRTVVGVDFSWDGDRWVVESILTANFPIASELLDETQSRSVYEQWEKYE
jgi:hypothetical protein